MTFKRNNIRQKRITSKWSRLKTYQNYVQQQSKNIQKENFLIYFSSALDYGPTRMSRSIWTGFSLKLGNHYYFQTGLFLKYQSFCFKINT